MIAAMVVSDEPNPDYDYPDYKPEKVNITDTQLLPFILHLHQLISGECFTSKTKKSETAEFLMIHDHFQTFTWLHVSFSLI